MSAPLGYAAVFGNRAGSADDDWALSPRALLTLPTLGRSDWGGVADPVSRLPLRPCVASTAAPAGSFAGR